MKNKSHSNICLFANPHFQRGASLLEGLAYLGIAALVMLGAVSLLTSAFGSAESNRGREEVVSIRTGVKKLYQGQANSYGEVDITSILNSAKVFPATLAPSGSGTTVVMKNGWGGDVSVTGHTNTFEILYHSVPKDACIAMVSGASGWTGISNSGGSQVAAFPVSPAAAEGLCTADSNDLTFTSI